MSLIENIKSITKTVSDAGNHELYQKLEEVSKEIYELSLENMQLKEELRILKQKQDEDMEKAFKDGAYYFGNEGPYCTNCYDDLGKKIRVHEEDNNMGIIYNTCPKCKFRSIKQKYPCKPVLLDTITF